MTSIEKRLQQTEAALYASLRALQEMDGLQSLSLNAEGASKTESRPQRSKAEKQKEWMQRPLRTSQDVLTWFRDEQEQPSTHSTRQDARLTGEATAGTIYDSKTQTTSTMPSQREDQPSACSQADPGAGMERLKACKPPSVPNASLFAGQPTSWLENYF